MKKILTTFFLLALFVPVALAAAPTAVLKWSAPTLNTDGSAITGAITYNVYQGATGAEIGQLTGVTTTTATLTGTPGTTSCFFVTAVVGGVESAHSNEVCKSFPNPIPEAPTGLSVT